MKSFAIIRSLALLSFLGITAMGCTNESDPVPVANQNNGKSPREVFTGATKDGIMYTQSTYTPAGQLIRNRADFYDITGSNVGVGNVTLNATLLTYNATDAYYHGTTNAGNPALQTWTIAGGSGHAPFSNSVTSPSVLQITYPANKATTVSKLGGWTMTWTNPPGSGDAFIEIRYDNAANVQYAIDHSLPIPATPDFSLAFKVTDNGSWTPSAADLSSIPANSVVDIYAVRYTGNNFTSGGLDYFIGAMCDHTVSTIVGP